MGRQRVSASCHKYSNTWYRRWGGQKWHRRHFWQHPTTRTLSSVWRLEYTGGKSPPKNLRHWNQKNKRWWHSELKSTMDYKHVRIKWVVYFKWDITWSTCTLHLWTRTQKIVYRPYTVHRPYTKGGIRYKHVAGPVRPRFGENQNSSTGFQGQR